MSFHGKPILGIVGGIGSGKSHVARALGQMGCVVIDSDQQSREAFKLPAVHRALRDLFGPEVQKPDGTIDRKLIAARVFENPILRTKLEAIIHPVIARWRDDIMEQHQNDPAVRAFVWDSPLLFEAGLQSQCDAVLFVDTPFSVRLHRVQTSRGWDEAELKRRERSQLSLDDKRRRSTHIVPGDTDDNRLRQSLEGVLNTIADQPVRQR